MSDSIINCTRCHAFYDAGREDPVGPELTGYGSREWLIGFLNDPAHPQFYGDRNDRMPSFGVDAVLNEQDIGLIADWLREDWYREDASLEPPGSP